MGFRAQELQRTIVVQEACGCGSSIIWRDQLEPQGEGRLEVFVMFFFAFLEQRLVHLCKTTTTTTTLAVLKEHGIRHKKSVAPRTPRLNNTHKIRTRSENCNQLFKVTRQEV